VAAFDFDGTLTNGGSVFPFLIAVRGLLPVVAAVVRSSPKLIRAAIVGGSSADESKEELFARLLGGIPSAQLDRTAATFAQRHLRKHLRPTVRRRMAWHQAQGHKVLIVSASPECYIYPVGDILGVDGVLATRLAVGGGGLITGHYEGKNCRGAEKYARVVGWMRSNGMSGPGTTQPVLWAYGNSRGDLRLLHAADHGIDAGQLGRLGRLHRFARLSSLSSDSS
jgi:phosphatidylglycerophosphatase C